MNPPLPHEPVKLTTAQRDLLALAVRAPEGNPWPLISMSQRAGGALHRTFEKMKAAGLFDADNVITPAGRAALVTVRRRQEIGG